MDVEGHVEAFNAAVRSGDWDEFVARFNVDARLEFVGPPVGPFVGRDAIADAYRTQPPDDTIAVNGRPYRDGDELVVPYRWQMTGATGTMRFTERDASIEQLVVTFD